MTVIDKRVSVTVADAVAKPGTYPDMTRRMQDAMDRVGASTVDDFAHKIGMATLKDVRDFYKWLSGQHRASLANWENVLAHVLLAEKGELEFSQSPLAVQDLRADVAALRVRVDEMAKAVELLLRSEIKPRRSDQGRS